MSCDQTTADAPRTADLAPDRRRFVLWLIVGVIGVHVVAMLGKIDEWPLSYYGMYSRLQPPYVEWHVVYGVTPAGDEVRLQDDDYWEPIGAARLTSCLRVMQRDIAHDHAASTAHHAKTEHAMARLLALYEANRRLGSHSGPHLAGLRLYEVTWRLDSRLANLESPDRRELVCEYVAGR